jgi:hypothetical protein
VENTIQNEYQIFLKSFPLTNLDTAVATARLETIDAPLQPLYKVIQTNYAGDIETIASCAGHPRPDKDRFFTIPYLMMRVSPKGMARLLSVYVLTVERCFTKYGFGIWRLEQEYNKRHGPVWTIRARWNSEISRETYIDSIGELEDAFVAEI